MRLEIILNLVVLGMVTLLWIRVSSDSLTGPIDEMSMSLRKSLERFNSSILQLENHTDFSRTRMKEAEKQVQDVKALLERHYALAKLRYQQDNDPEVALLSFRVLLTKLAANEERQMEEISRKASALLRAIERLDREKEILAMIQVEVSN